ncbi:MAG: energy-coupling factor transporter transmembrane component T [Candidatus Bathyarchaeia archaeon]
MSFTRTYILYIPKDSIIHRLDPLTKLIILFTLTIQAVIVREPISNTLIFIVSIALFLLAKLPLKILINFLKYWVLVFLIAFITYGYAYRNEGSPLLNLSLFSLTDIGFLLFISIIFRFSSIVTVGLLFYCSTTQRDVIVGFRKLKLPYTATFTFALAIRSLSILYDDYRRIRDAQMARATEFEKGNTLMKVKKMLMILIPLIVIALNRVSTISSSIEARGFSVKDKKKRTFYYNTKMKPLDYTISFILLVETVIVIILVLYGYFDIYWFISVLKH